MERRGLHYFEEAHPSAAKHVGLILRDLNAHLSAEMLTAAITALVMVEYFGLPQLDLQPSPEEVKAMFRDLVDRELATVSVEEEDCECGMLDILYNTNAAVDHVGRLIGKLGSDKLAVFIRSAKICSAVASAQPSRWRH